MHWVHNLCARSALPIGICGAYLRWVTPDPLEMIMFTALAKRLRTYREHRIAVSHLARMDSHELADIGISCQDIDLVVRRGRLQF